MRREANQKLDDLYQNSNSVFYLLKRIKKKGKDLEGGRGLRGRNERLRFIEDRAKIGRKAKKRL